MVKSQPLIVVSSVSVSSSFYCALLGAESGHGGEDYEQILLGSELLMQLRSFEPDANHVALADQAVPLGNGVVLWFERDDFSGVLERIEQMGAKPDREPTENPFARQMEVWLHDPDGYQIVVAGPPGYSRQPVDNLS